MRKGVSPGQDDPHKITARQRYLDWVDENKRNAERLYAMALARGAVREAEIFKYAAEQIIDHNNAAPFTMMGRMNKLPVTIDEFISSKEFLGDLFDIWPTLMPDLRSMNPDVFTGQSPVFEALLGGSTGTGKTHLSQATIMYQAYLFSCFNEPQRLFKLTPNTRLVFMLQSVSPTVTRRVIYMPMRDTMTNMPYVQKWMPYDTLKESTLEFANKLVIAPAAASLQSMVGQAIPGGILDEVNFMSIVENSKQVPGATGMGGHFDQADVVYTNMSRRRKRSFLTKGYSMGCLCVVSSTRYKDDFLDRRIDEVRRFDEKNVVALRRKQYEVAPPERYSGEKFNVIIGTGEYPTRIVEDWEEAGTHYPENAQIEPVPVELKTDFMRNPEGAQRDYIGIATAAITPFIRRRQKINDALSRGLDRDLPALVEKDRVDLTVDGMPTFVSDAFARMSDAQKAKPRWVHIDLSRVKDRCGIGMVRLDGFGTNPIKMGAGFTGQGAMETLPKFTVELAVGIQPSPIREIDIAEVRGWVMRLFIEYGLNIQGVSLDGFDSQETLQTFRKSGIVAERISVDLTMAGYEGLRDALYEDRLDIQPDCELLAEELRTIEYIATKDKVDHPPRGCFVGDTPVLLADGTTRRFDDLAAAGEDVDILTYDIAAGVFRVATGCKPRETMRTTKLVELELEDGTVYRCTPCHRILLTSGEWRAAGDLREDDDIQTLDPTLEGCKLGG